MGFPPLLFADMELSCDEKVLKICGDGQKKAYAYALIGIREKKPCLPQRSAARKRGCALKAFCHTKNDRLFRGLLRRFIAVFAAALLTNAAV